MKANRNLGSWYWLSKFFFLFLFFCGCPVTVSTGRCLINAKGTEKSWWFPEGENVGLITAFLSQDGADNTKRVITRPRYAWDAQQQQQQAVNEWHISYQGFHSPCDKECLLLQSVFVRDPWIHLWKSSIFSQAARTPGVQREGEVPSEFLASKHADLFTFIFNIG